MTPQRDSLLSRLRATFRMASVSRDQRRITATLFLVSSLNSAATIGSFILTPIIAYTLSGNALLVGLPNALAMAGRAAAGYPLGWVLDKVGRRAGFAVGLSFATAGMLISAVAIGAGSLTFFLAASILKGVGRAALEQTRFAAAEVFPVAQQAQVIGLMVFAGTVGAVGGPLLVAPAVAMARAQGFEENMGPFVLGAAITIVSLILLLVALRPDPKQLAAKLQRVAASAARIAGDSPSALHDVGDDETRTGYRQVLRILNQPDIKLAFAAMVLGHLVMTLLMVVTPLHMNRADYSTQAISWVFMGHTLGMFGLSGVTGWLTAKVGRVPLIFAGALLQILSAILLPLSSELPVLVLALFLLGLGWNFSYIAGSSLLSAALESSRQRSRVQGINEALVAIASAVGSLGTGGVYSISGVVAVSVSGIVFSAALGILALWLGRAHLFPTLAQRSS